MLAWPLDNITRQLICVLNCMLKFTIKVLTLYSHNFIFSENGLDIRHFCLI